MYVEQPLWCNNTIAVLVDVVAIHVFLCLYIQTRSNPHHGSLDILGNWEEEEPHTTAHYGN